MILQYGAGTQKKMADFSQSALENVKTKDLGEIGELLSDVVKELKDFDVDEEEKGFFGIFKKASNRVQTLKNRYSKAETHISQITSTLEAHQRMLLKDVAILDKMYELNLSYFRDLTIYILAGKKKLGEMRDGKLKELIEKAHASGLPKTRRRQRIWNLSVSGLRKKSMTWSLPGPLPSRRRPRSAWYRVTIP